MSAQPRKPLYSKHFKDCVMGYVDWWKQSLHLTDWKIDIVFLPDNHPSRYDATISHEIPYKIATLSIYPVMVTDRTQDVIEETIIHELNHIVVGKIADLMENLLAGKLVTAREAEEAEEECVSHLTAAFLSVKPAQERQKQA